MILPETPAPFVRGNDCSEAAAKSIEPHLGRLETIIMGIIRASQGMTCDEVEDVTGISHQCCSARLRGLTLKGLLYDSGERRATRSGRKAAVLKATTYQGEFAL